MQGIFYILNSFLMARAAFFFRNNNNIYSLCGRRFTQTFCAGAKPNNASGGESLHNYERAERNNNFSHTVKSVKT